MIRVSSILPYCSNMTLGILGQPGYTRYTETAVEVMWQPRTGLSPAGGDIRKLCERRGYCMAAPKRNLTRPILWEEGEGQGARWILSLSNHLRVRVDCLYTAPNLWKIWGFLIEKSQASWTNSAYLPNNDAPPGCVARVPSIQSLIPYHEFIWMLVRFYRLADWVSRNSYFACLEFGFSWMYEVVWRRTILS